jgi:uncharacterized membrane protein YdbT with pleckstrin-like domain
MSNPKQPKMTLKPSQWINAGWIIIGIVGMPLVLPTLVALYKLLEVYTWSYTVDQEFIIEKKGVFSVTHLETNMYRIKSFRFEEPFLMRLVGIGNLHIQSSDPYQPELVLFGIPKGTQIWEMLRTKTLSSRKKFGVKEYDLYNL